MTAFDAELDEMDKKAEKKKLRELGTSTKADGESDDNIESSSEADSDDESSSDEEDENIDIKFPNTNIEDLHQFISRDLTNMRNKEDGQKRKFALIKLYQIFVLARNKAPPKIYQELLPEIQKHLFKALTDKIEKNRELAALIIKEFYRKCDDLTLSIPYLLPVLIERLNADDLEGVDFLDEKMKP